MGALGNTMDESIALVTAGAEVLTHQSGKVARGLRSIGNNIANTAKKTGQLTYAVGNTTKSLNLFDEQTNDLKSTYKVMETLKADWDKMSNSQKQSLAITLAGKVVLARLKPIELLGTP